jgi:outer membrane receptor protein involved in Fe transport
MKISHKTILLSWLLSTASFVSAQNIPSSPNPTGDLPQTADTVDAQQAVQSDPAAAAVADIIVTGSRTVTDPLKSPTPLTVITSQENQLARPGNVIEGLTQVPSLSASNSGRNAQAQGGIAQGAEVLNLRNLGGQRTLVLVDGRRMLPTALDGTSDLRLVPQALISRTDIVTGGASAAYGSDAVAGVVNLVLDTKFNGLKGVAQGGISQRGDGDTQRIELTGGTDFGDGRGHLIVSVTAARQSSIDYESDRKWGRRNVALVNVPGASPANQRLENVGVAATYGGVILSGPLANTQFLPGGVAAPFTPGTINTPLAIVGSPDTSNTYGTIAAGYRLLNPFGRLSYDVSDHFKPYIQATGSISEVQYRPNDQVDFGAYGHTIFSGNPFIPAALQAQMTANNIASFPLARQSNDFGISRAVQKNHVLGLSIGATGKISGDWDYSAYFDRGTTRTVGRIFNNLNRENLFAATDAVIDPASGRPVCRTDLTAPGARPGCVPINLFGVGSPSAEAIDYVTGTSYWELHIRQEIAAASANGTLFTLNGEPVKLAFGAEYRKVTMRQDADPFGVIRKNADRAVRGFPAALQGTVGLWALGNNGSTSGSYDIKEGFLELNVPLLRDSPLGRSLDINGAVRYADYSTSGGVATWKVGLAYQPFEDLRLRGTVSRDIRAANLGELYTAQTSQAVTVNDRISGRGNVGIIANITGNTALRPEKALTYTGGATYRPSWLPGLGMSLDYYNISIDGAIQALSPQQTVDQCAAGLTTACALITRTPDGTLNSIQTPYLNLATLKTSGLEGEISYSTGVGEGELSIRALAQYLLTYNTTLPGGLPRSTAGVIGSGVGSGGTQGNAPHLQANVRVTYTNQPLTIFVQERLVGSGTYDNTYVEGVTINDNSVPAVFYTDMTAQYRLPVKDKEVAIFVTINNLFDRDPPAVESSSFIFHPQTNGLLYDKMGRYITVGARFNF